MVLVEQIDLQNKQFLFQCYGLYHYLSNIRISDEWSIKAKTGEKWNHKTKISDSKPDTILLQITYNLKRYLIYILIWKLYTSLINLKDI